VDWTGEINPYVKLSVGRTKKKTTVVEKTNNPEWNEPFEFEVEDPVRTNLVIKVRDKRSLGKDSRIGDDLYIWITDIIRNRGKLPTHALTLEADSKIILTISYKEH